MKLRRCFRCLKRVCDPILNTDGTYTIECENCKKEGVTIGIYNKPLDELVTIWNSLTPAEGFLLDSEDPKRIISSMDETVVERIGCFILEGKKIEITVDHDFAIKDILKGRNDINCDILNLNDYESIMKSIDLCKVSFHCGICDISYDERKCSKRSKLAIIDMFQTSVFYTKVKKITILIFKQKGFDLKSFDNISDCILFLSDAR